MNERLRKRKILMREKKDKVIELKNRYEIIRAFVKRNCYLNAEKNKGIRISLPFIGITFCERIPKIERKDLNSIVVIPLDNIFEIVGDIDLLIKSGIDVFN